MVVPLGLRPGFPAGAGEGGGRRALGLGRIAHVEHRKLESAHLSRRGIDVAADAEQVRRIERMEVGRVAGHLELAGHTRGRGVGQIDDEQRVDLAERAHVSHVADEADRVDPLTLGQTRDAADRPQVAPRGLEHVHAARGLVAEASGRRHAEQAVGALVERKLVERESRYGPHRHERDGHLLQVERVDVRRRIDVGRVPPRAEVRRRHVEGRRRCRDLPGHAGDRGHGIGAGDVVTHFERHHRQDRFIGG